MTRGLFNGVFVQRSISGSIDALRQDGISAETMLRDPGPQTVAGMRSIYSIDICAEIQSAASTTATASCSMIP